MTGGPGGTHAAGAAASEREAAGFLIGGEPRGAVGGVVAGGEDAGAADKAAAGVIDVFHIAVVLKAAADHDVVGGAVGGGIGIDIRLRLRELPGDVQLLPGFCGEIKTDEPRTLDFSGVRGFLVTNVCIVQRSAA